MDRLRFLLSVASSQDPSGLKEAEAELSSLNKQPRFHAALLSLVSDTSVDFGVRLQAVLYLKNGIDMYWRKTAPNAISEEEKIEIRHGLLQCFHEASYPIALQLAVVISKAARFDVPKEWPELFPALMQAVQSEDSLVQHRALLFLHHTIKTLATKRLGLDRKFFHDLIQDLLPYLLRIWTVHHGQFIQSPVGIADSQVVATLEKAVLAMKVLRKSVVLGLRRPHENEEAMTLLVTCLDEIRTLLTIRSTRFASLRDILEKYIILHLKLLSDLLENHPASFIPIMKQTLQLMCLLCFSEDNQPLLFQRCIIFGLNILKQVLTCPEYKTVSSPLHQQADLVKKDFFDSHTVNIICRNLIFKYLPLSREDLELWDADPEQYALEEGGDSWRYSYRPCCETVFLTVFHEFRDKLAATLVDIVHSCNIMMQTSDLNAILHKDAIYNAVGLAAFDLYDEIDFDQWLLNGIAQELSITDPNYRIVRRRAAWLIGQWSGVKLSADLRPKLYQLLLPLLESNVDLVVRLSAAKALKVVIDDFEFTSEEMKPFLSTAFLQLFGLLKEVQECDTKLGILNVLSYLLERVGAGIRSICQELAHFLPSLWDSSVDHNMLRCSIIATLVFIVPGLGAAVDSLAPFLYEVINLSTDQSQPCSVYLLEDGLDLWLSVLHTTKDLLPVWKQLAKNIPPILDLGSERLRSMVYIIQAYIILEPDEFLNSCGKEINASLEALYCELVDEGQLMILHVLDMALKIGPASVPSMFATILLHSFRAIHDGNMYPKMMSLHLSIASRLLLRFPNEFNELINQLAVEVQEPPDQVAGRILDIWLNKMACVYQLEQRKLLALALSSLLTSGSQVIVDRIYSLFLNVTETLNDVIRTDEETQNMIDSLQLNSDKLIYVDDQADEDSEHEHRKRLLAAKDIVYTVNLKDYFQSQLIAWAALLGRSKYEEIMQNVDVKIMSNMREFVKL